MTDVKPEVEMDFEVVHDEGNDDLIAMLNSLGIATNWGSMSPLYGLVSKRLMTFSNWPAEKQHLVEAIAAAGFYYTGHSDYTRCFSCRLLASNWLDVHDPWEHHALWGEDCSFVRLHKGAQYVDEVKKMWVDYVRKDRNKSSRGIWGVVCAVGHRLCSYIYSFCRMVFKSELKSADVTSVDTVDTEDQTNNELLCRLCYQNQIAVVYLPCRHMISCSDCLAPDICSVCEHTVRACVDVYLS